MDSYEKLQEEIKRQLLQIEDKPLVLQWRDVFIGTLIKIAIKLGILEYKDVVNKPE